MSVLVLVEHDNKVMDPATRNVLTAALALETQVVLMVVGFACEAVALQAATLPGVKAVWLIDDEVYLHQLPELLGVLVSSLAAAFTYILAPATTYGKNVLPRIAALLDVAQVSEVTRIRSVDTVEHFIYAGNAVETVRMLDKQKLMTIRTTAFDPTIGEQPACGIEKRDQVVHEERVQFMHHEVHKSTRPALSQASIVVAGGRGLQSAEQFNLILQLADVLSAGVGASRAAVDAQFVSNDYQVGQTGKVVAPLLYIAIGISGAVQHIAGMKASKVIVAINKDPDAPIFQVADYGLVGDLFEIIPALIKQIEDMKTC